MSNRPNFWETTVGKTAKVALYVGMSAVIGYVISLIANDPAVFGVATPIVNVFLVAIKNYFDQQTPNTTSSPG